MCVLFILIAVILTSLKLLVDSTYEKLELEIDNVYSENLLDLGKEAAMGVDIFYDFSINTLLKSKLITEELINETIYKPHPILWEETKAYTWEEYLELEGIPEGL